MKVFTYKDDGNDIIINPSYIREIKGTRSEYNNNWCIVIDMVTNNSHENSVKTLLFDKESDYQDTLNEIISAMESR